MNEKEKLIKEKIEEEDFVEMMQLRGIKRIVFDDLVATKGYNPGEILLDPAITVKVGDLDVQVSMDFIIHVNDLSFAVIKCANTNLDAWVRYVTAFARTIEDYQIPFAVVSAGDEVRVIDILSSSSEILSEFPDRVKAGEIMGRFSKIPYDNAKIMRERRIIHAFEGLKNAASATKESFSS